MLCTLALHLLCAWSKPGVLRCTPCFTPTLHLLYPWSAAMRSPLLYTCFTPAAMRSPLRRPAMNASPENTRPRRQSLCRLPYGVYTSFTLCTCFTPALHFFAPARTLHHRGLGGAGPLLDEAPRSGETIHPSTIFTHQLYLLINCGR